MTFSKIAPDHFPVFPLAPGVLWGSPRALRGPHGAPWGPHGGDPPPPPFIPIVPGVDLIGMAIPIRCTPG